MKSLTTLILIGLAMCYSCVPSTNKRSQNNSRSIKSLDIVEDTLKYDNGIQSSDSLKDNNMRGFDPASEDDMKDNGVSRYMDNNDEEGWN